MRRPGLFTDLYQLTMMQGYGKAGIAERPACFELFYRRVPERGGYAIAAGLEPALEWLEAIRFEPDDLDWLRSLGLFDREFLSRLGRLHFRGTVRAVPEGTVVFPGTPILQVEATLEEAQWVETGLLNLVNFQTLIATKASRIAREAAPADVIELGLRRAQGPDGGLGASRAAWIGGCSATSNVEAGRLHDIPVVGTHAHAWVMSFPDELTAFRVWAEQYPRNAVLLIDTFDTLTSGIVNAVIVAYEMEKKGRRLKGVRLDSGDLGELSRECRKRLNAAGLEYVRIIASGDVDEWLLRDLAGRHAVDGWGVGTRLVTSFQEPALGGVYKLVASFEGNAWAPKFKRSSTPAKATLPGRKQLWRVERDGRLERDVLSLIDEPAPELALPRDPGVEIAAIGPGSARPLLESRMERGRRLTPAEPLSAARARCGGELGKLAGEFQRIDRPDPFPVGLSSKLAALRDHVFRGR